MIIPTDLPDDIDALKAQIAERDAIILVKDELIAHYKRALYGAKSEKRDPEQNQLTLEDLETEIYRYTA